MGQPNFSRRTFLGAAAGLSCRAASAASPSGRVKLHEFAYSQVKLTGGPLASQYQRAHGHFLSLDEDRLLKVYRQRAGLPAPGADMGGWYDAEGFVPGHLIGQFISGLSRIHAATGDPQASGKARRLVEGYAACFERDGNPFASPKASTTWPCYILDKYQIGLLDAAKLAGVPEARALLPRVIQSATRFIPDNVYDRGPDSPKQAPYDEPYILPENLFQSYELTGEKRFFEMAKMYLLNQEYFHPLAEGRNVLPGKHGYSHVIALSSAAKAYEVLGDAKYLRAIRNAWDMLAETQQYASGGWAPKEAFVKPGSGELAASLTATRDHFETPCGYYAHSKLARYLLRFTGDGRYGDGLERVLLNTVLGAIEPDDDGGYFYYSDYQARARKEYYKRKWPCCAGTFLQSVADYPINLYFQDSRGIYVNLFADSEVSWKPHAVPVKLVQRTRYPEAETIELRLEPEAPVEFDVSIRIPGWLRRPAQLSVNGKSVAVKSERGFATIRRHWRKNDTVEITLPFDFRTVPIDSQNPNTVALMRGPVMMSAVDPPAELAATANALARMDAAPGGPLEFDCRTLSGMVRMRPFYRVGRELYTTYIRLLPEA